MALFWDHITGEMLVTRCSAVAVFFADGIASGGAAEWLRGGWTLSRVGRSPPRSIHSGRVAWSFRHHPRFGYLYNPSAHVVYSSFRAARLDEHTGRCKSRTAPLRTAVKNHLGRNHSADGQFVTDYTLIS